LVKAGQIRPSPFFMVWGTYLDKSEKILNFLTITIKLKILSKKQPTTPEKFLFL